MNEIKTMEAYMTQQKARKNFIDYEDLKLLEQHLSGDKTNKTVWGRQNWVYAT